MRPALTPAELAEARQLFDQKPQLRMQLGPADKGLEEFALILRAYREALYASGKGE